MPATTENVSTATCTPARSVPEQFQSTNIQNEISEALDQEKRKHNLIIFNFPTTDTDNAAHIELYLNISLAPAHQISNAAELVNLLQTRYGQ